MTATVFILNGPNKPGRGLTLHRSDSTSIFARVTTKAT